MHRCLNLVGLQEQARANLVGLLDQIGFGGNYGVACRIRVIRSGLAGVWLRMHLDCSFWNASSKIDLF